MSYYYYTIPSLCHTLRYFIVVHVALLCNIVDCNDGAFPISLEFVLHLVKAQQNVR